MTAAKMALVALVSAVTACHAETPHWDLRCTERRFSHFLHVHTGKTLILQPQYRCVRRDSTWHDPQRLEVSGGTPEAP